MSALALVQDMVLANYYRTDSEKNSLYLLLGRLWPAWTINFPEPDPLFCPITQIEALQTHRDTFFIICMHRHSRLRLAAIYRRKLAYVCSLNSLEKPSVFGTPSLL